MKKTFLVILITISYFENSYSQGGIWTWISGSNATGSLGVFGTQGIPSVNNHPPGLYEYSEWKDKQGNFWLYGGYTPAFSDLWKYDPLTNEWTWVKGNGLIGQSAVYGIKGIPNIANTPGERHLCPATWVDTTGNLWLFGANLYQNDLWKYDIGTNEWTWVSGSNGFNATGVHGTQGIPGPLNVPGARREACSAWTDSLNNLWLFGGEGYDDAGALGLLNDLMKYDIATNEWTWISGSAFANSTGSYGSVGIPDVMNSPPGRFTYTKWKDVQGNFWLMGGYYYDSGDYAFDDVWRYDGATNIWTWMAGTNGTNDGGLYQMYCMNDTVNRPASRMEHRSAVTDHCGRFWLFGGITYSTYTYLNDLWIFDPALARWNWVSGSNVQNQFGNYGTLGVASPANIPPSRRGAIAWWGNDERFYLFGGSQNGIATGYSDLWVFTPDSICTGSCNIYPAAAFSAINNICPGTCTDFLNLSYYAISYQWTFPGASPDTSTSANPTNICYQNSGSYDVQLIATNGNGSDTLLLNNYIMVYPAPPAQSIIQIGDTLFAIAGAATYQWYFNGNIINGATDYFYVALASGNYNIVATDANGCEVEAVIFDVITNALSIADPGTLTIYPNPVTSQFSIQNSSFTIGTALKISIFNLMGEKILSATGREPLTVNCDLLPSGLYWLEISDGKQIYRARFVNQ